MTFKKSVLVLIAAAACMVSTAFGGVTAPSAFLPEQVYTFDPVVEGTEVVHDFILRNNGTAELEIINLKSG